MKEKTSNKRIVGMDLHPDIFSAAALQPHRSDPGKARVEWVHDRQPVANLERWAARHLRKGDTVVLEASGNSFEVAHRLDQAGHKALVLESAQSSALKHNYCDDDRYCAVKLARSYLTGLAKEVWQPGKEVREHREVFFAHRNAVKDSTRTRNRIRSYLNEQCIRLKSGTSLTDEKTPGQILALRDWGALQAHLLTDLFSQLRHAETRRRQLEELMVRELIAHPHWAQLWRLMGIRHKVAFGLMALMGDVRRFATAKKLCAYIGLSPRKEQSGKDAKGREKGIGNNGRKDLRALLLQSAHNALLQRGSPLHKWGWKLLVRKHRNLAAAAVARKLTVSIWHLLMGHHSDLEEASAHLSTKLLKIATVLGKEALRQLGFSGREAFVQHLIESIKNTSKKPALST